jgi:hypothetical protein
VRAQRRLQCGEQIKGGIAHMNTREGDLKSTPGFGCCRAE